MRVDVSGAITCLRFPLLEQVGGVRHAITTRLGGLSNGPYASTNLGLSVGDDRDHVIANRRLAAMLVGLKDALPVTVRQVHGVEAALATEPGQPGVHIADADLLATRTSGVVLMVQTADCLPLILIDPARRAVAAMHSGWRGLAANAGREAVSSMQRLFGTRPQDLLIGVGPGIGACCYEVDNDVADAVSNTAGNSANRFVRRSAAKPYIDLEGVMLHQLSAAGVLPDHVVAASLCTACNLALLYSHRREGVPTGRFGALVAISEMTTGNR